MYYTRCPHTISGLWVSFLKSYSASRGYSISIHLQQQQQTILHPTTTIKHHILQPTIYMILPILTQCMFCINNCFSFALRLCIKYTHENVPNYMYMYNSTHWLLHAGCMHHLLCSVSRYSWLISNDHVFACNNTT